MGRVKTVETSTAFLRANDILAVFYELDKESQSVKLF
jgi:hypothetical protein